MHIYVYLVLHICAYFVHIYTQSNFAYMSIFFLHILAYYDYYKHILHILFLLICAYSCIFGSAYFSLFCLYFCIFKSAYYGIFTLLHIQAYNTYICI